MRLSSYLEILDIEECGLTRFDLEIKGVSSRSWEINEGYAFVCVKGSKSDGHSFALDAKEAGASLLIVEEVTDAVKESGIPYIKVKNTRKALTKMCACRYGNPERNMKMIGVTGTNGKTSTCRILSEIYKKAGVGVETLGTLGGGLTTPDPEDLFRLIREAFDRGRECIVMEASSHALALDKLCGIVFDTAIFTNLTPEHLDFHSDMTQYAAAKARLFKQARKSLYNLDSDYCKEVSSAAFGKGYTYSLLQKNADFFGDLVTLHGRNGISYDIVTSENRTSIDSRLCGRYNVYNTLAAAAAAYTDGIDGKIIHDAIRQTEHIDGRLQRVDVGNAPFTLYIDYAHTPDALENVLRSIREFRSDGERLTVVFGCGGDRDKSKRRVMGRIASLLADFVIVTSDNSRSENTSDIINDILKGIDKERPYKVIENRREAIEYAVQNAEDNEIILLAGKGHEDYEIDKYGKRYFSEREITVQAVKKRLKRNDY